MEGFLAPGLRLQSLGKMQTLRDRIESGELWSLLQAVAYVASLDDRLVIKTKEWEDQSDSPNRPVQLSAAVRDLLKYELSERRANGKATSFDGASRSARGYEHR